jgi:16S rRNA (guanine966-N2)-methyltransferase
MDMRVIAGEFRGRRIVAPKGTHTRPTSDFVRETAFNLIGPVDGATVLDLYAGSGALGIEALSRGARRAVFVDNSREACRTIGANLATLGLQATVLCQDAERALAAERGPYDLILADPPYDFSAYDRLAPRFARLLAEDGLVVLQTPAAAEPELEGLATRTSRRYGSARLTLFGL